jgi:hypothetical protein
MFKYKLVLVCLGLLLCQLPASAPIKEKVLVCIRWQWVGPPVEGRVTCIEWIYKDCSNRLYPEICKLGG